MSWQDHSSKKLIEPAIVVIQPVFAQLRLGVNIKQLSRRSTTVVAAAGAGRKQAQGLHGDTDCGDYAKQDRIAHST